MTTDEKWTVVQKHYSQAYPEQSHLFKVRLEDKIVETLYDRLQKLMEEQSFYEELNHKFRRFANQPLK